MTCRVKVLVTRMYSAHKSSGHTKSFTVTCRVKVLVRRKYSSHENTRHMKVLGTRKLMNTWDITKDLPSSRPKNRKETITWTRRFYICIHSNGINRKWRILPPFEIISTRQWSRSVFLERSDFLQEEINLSRDVITRLFLHNLQPVNQRFQVRLITNPYSCFYLATSVISPVLN